MRRYTVHLMTPYCSWGRIEADSKEMAIRICKQDKPKELDPGEPIQFLAMEEE